MKNNEKIKPQEERRRTVKYGYDENFQNGFKNDVLRCGYCSFYGGSSFKTREIYPKDMYIDVGSYCLSERTDRTISKL